MQRRWGNIRLKPEQLRAEDWISPSNLISSILSLDWLPSWFHIYRASNDVWGELFGVLLLAMLKILNNRG